jgi:hypothetical protein
MTADNRVDLNDSAACGGHQRKNSTLANFRIRPLALMRIALATKEPRPRGAEYQDPENPYGSLRFAWKKNAPRTGEYTRPDLSQIRQ